MARIEICKMPKPKLNGSIIVSHGEGAHHFLVQECADSCREDEGSRFYIRKPTNASMISRGNYLIQWEESYSCVGNYKDRLTTKAFEYSYPFPEQQSSCTIRSESLFFNWVSRNECAEVLNTDIYIRNKTRSRIALVHQP
ncbi:unnamed protein product [Dovyalis caffra]|uniref:Uncharacterized protein n=1 Tax=Dovyalis caffra TaxID=77055 RepID=A0AAV1SA76_9ROSI|nr:unnamed protein product [Dovyalis caffra]